MRTSVFDYSAVGGELDILIASIAARPFTPGLDIATTPIGGGSSGMVRGIPSLFSVNVPSVHGSNTGLYSVVLLTGVLRYFEPSRAPRTDG
jgi:hypothetical protein